MAFCWKLLQSHLSLERDRVFDKEVSETSFSVNFHLIQHNCGVFHNGVKVNA